MSRHPQRLTLLAALLAPLVLLGSSCGDGDGDAGPADSPTTGTEADGLSGDVTVLAAGSLTEAFTAIGEEFESAHPGVGVTFGFGASSTLAQQALDGAPADLLAGADEETMRKAVDGGAAADPVVFARNRLAVLVGRGNPKQIKGLEDLSRSDVVLVLCAVQVPCGRFAAQALEKAGVTAAPKSYEETVKAVVSRVALGEADAGIVYVTDARAAAGRADRVEIPDADNVTAAYPLAVLEQSRNPEAAAAFRDFVAGAEGQRILAGFGFLSP